MDGMSQIVTTLATFWVDLPTSNLTGADGSASPTVEFLRNGLWYWTAALAVLGVIVGGARMAWEQRGTPVRQLIMSLLTLVLVSGAGLAVIAFLLAAADAFSFWIIDESTDGKGFANSLQSLLLIDQEGIGVFLLIVLGLIGIITSFIQIVLMVIRSGMLVILAGVLPTTAAFTNTEMGRQWFQKTIGWTLAFILYKPAAAIVYATAFQLMGTQWGGTDNPLLNAITGMALMVVALLALPALMRFVVPMVGAVTAGAGGGAMAAGAVGAVATGAVSLGHAGSGRGTASPTPASSAGSGGNAPSAVVAASGSTVPGGRSGPTSGGQRPSGPGHPDGSSAPGSRAPAMAPAGGGLAGAVSGRGAFSDTSTGGAAASKPTSGVTAAGAAKGAGPAGLAAGVILPAGSEAARSVRQAAEDAVEEGPGGSTGR
jgi:hypothetical protein